MNKLLVLNILLSQQNIDMFKSILNQRSSTHARIILYGLLLTTYWCLKPENTCVHGQEEEPTVQEEQLQLLRLLIGLKMSLKFFDQWEAKPSPIAPCKGELSRPLSAS